MLDPQFVNPLVLPHVALQNRKDLPHLPAIYFVLENEEIVYIGRASSLLLRWRQHHRLDDFKGLQGVIKIAWVECSDLCLLPTVEEVLISHFRPKFNTYFEPESLQFGSIRWRLAEVRKERGMSQNALAKAAGMTLQNVQHLEKKAKSVPFETLDNLCNVLQCTPADLIEYAPNNFTRAQKKMELIDD